MREPAVIDARKASASAVGTREVPTCCMVTSRHRCDDSRILGLEARSLLMRGFSVAWIGPHRGEPRGDEGVRYNLFSWEQGFVARTFALLRALRQTPALVYQCHEPDATLLALLVGKPRGAKVIFDAHEFFRAYLRTRAPRGFRWLATAAYAAFELVAYRLCDHLITVSDGVADEMAKLITRRKITVVANCSGPSVLPLREPALWPTRLRILHLGTASFYHQLQEMLEAFRLVRVEVPDAEFLQIGRIPDEELAWMRTFEQANGLVGAISYIPRVPFEQLGAYIPCAHVGLIARHADNNATIGFPTKLFDYMTFGVPIVSTELVSLRKFNEQFRAATLVDTRCPAEIADAILELDRDPALRDQYRKNGLAAVRSEYAWDHMLERLLGVYDRILPAGTASGGANS
jgi:glycosyltransferase involved in cell wall biosynthesis